MERIYLLCAIVGGGLFLLRSILMLVGLGGDDQAHGGDDVSDVSDSALDDGSAVASLRLVTLHGLTAFLMTFGLIGFLVLRSPEIAAWCTAAEGETNAAAVAWIAGIAATLSGLIVMLIIAKLFQSSRKFESDGTIYPKEIVGVEGSVYLTIRPGDIGKVQLTVRDALKVYDARAKDPSLEIKTGERIKVVETSDVLVVVGL
ncbi:MAG: hypothetical protein FWF84_03830 [Kiritimatiellaeota bacterium]|nr:hypothetical protein [Kiritimatiellota bacterium]